MTARPLIRGGNVSLTREIPGLRTVAIGAAWDKDAEPALADNLRLAAILCGSNGRVGGASDFVYLNQVISSDLSVEAMVNALGDDVEQLEIDLADVPAHVERVVVVLYVNEGMPRRRTLGQLRTCQVRVLDASSQSQIIASENLADGFVSETAVVLGEIYRHRGDWKFKVVGQGYAAGLTGVFEQYGIPA